MGDMSKIKPPDLRLQEVGISAPPPLHKNCYTIYVYRTATFPHITTGEEEKE